MDLDFYNGITQEMLGRLNRLRSFTKHAPSIGFCHEEILRSTLRQLLSPRFQLRTGFAYNDSKQISYQGDILIIDENDPSPYLFQEGNLVVAQARAVACVIEVKSTLNKKSFIDAINNLHTFKSVSIGDTTKPYTPTFLFAFNGNQFKPNNLGNWYKEISIEDVIQNYPHIIFSLNQGMLSLVPSTIETGIAHFGHRHIIGGLSKDSKIQSLSIFLASVRKQIERRAGLSTNPFEQAQFNDLSVSKYYFRYGIGLVTE